MSKGSESVRKQEEEKGRMRGVESYVGLDVPSYYFWSRSGVGWFGCPQVLQEHSMTEPFVGLPSCPAFTADSGAV